MARAFCVGLTGGVGAGKSTVAQSFSRLGCEIVDTDVIAHALTAPGGLAIPAIVEAFGSDVVARDGGLDRAAMRARVFADTALRERLEAILHPHIRAQAEQAIRRAGSAYVVLVVPLLAEHIHAYRPLIDRVLVVDCTPELQLRRTAARPGIDEAQARAILAAQASRSSRLALADDVIDNEGGLAELERQIARLHGSYLALASRASEKTRNNPLQ